MTIWTFMTPLIVPIMPFWKGLMPKLFWVLDLKLMLLMKCRQRSSTSIWSAVQTPRAHFILSSFSTSVEVINLKAKKSRIAIKENGVKIIIKHFWTLSYTIEQYRTLLNTIKHYWKLSNTIEHYRTLLNTIEHYWTLSLFKCSFAKFYDSQEGAHKTHQHF